MKIQIKKPGVTSVKTGLLILSTILLPTAKDSHKTSVLSALMLMHDVHHFYVISFSAGSAIYGCLLRRMGSENKHLVNKKISILRERRPVAKFPCSFTKKKIRASENPPE